ncbi:LuxR C-terminal-related transcriptional regulator [Arthrobacter sp. LAPM80]|uniref:LuxR C-terminal-related transcriptional regulator n=1 Tax=Arthrobacter sp. LAPM80 TaxID=3141788 RepID=UPI00398ABEA7
MTIYNDVAAPTWLRPARSGTFGAMGAAERKLWSSFVRQAEIDVTVKAINEPATYGVVVLGPWGVGKTSLAHAVEEALSATTHIERLFGSPAETLIAYGPLSMLMARLTATSLESPTGIIQGIDELIRADAAGRDVLLVVDELPGLDTMTVGVLMHLLMGGTAKLLVLARELGQLPEDLVWLAKDGMLGEVRLDRFTRAEVGELIAKATGTFVSESAVTALHKASNGIPLVLQALFSEQVAKGSIKKHLGGWVLKDPINMDASSTLAEIVRARLAREETSVRLGVEKMSLLGNAPLHVASSVLGEDVLWQLEERGYVQISGDGRHRASLTEGYVGDIVRSVLTTERKAELLAEIAMTFDRELDSLDWRETMSLAAWTLDAGMVLEPRFGLAAAISALRHFDPVLALRCTAQIPIDHPLRVKAAQARSTAYRLLADYGSAVAELDTVPATVISALTAEELGSWTLALTGALLWVPEGKRRIPGLLEAAGARVTAAWEADHSGSAGRARRMVDLARCEFQVYHGEFLAVVEDLEAAVKDSDVEYSLNSACLLVPTLAAVGREVESAALGQRIAAEIAQRGFTPLFSDYYRNGLANAQIWSGLWVECVQRLRRELEGMHTLVPYRGGLIELDLGLAHAYAGRGAEGVQVLMSAAAQLEARNCDNALGLAYSALAFCFAQVNNAQEAQSYLAMASSVPGPTLWTNTAMSEFFKLMALRWLDDPRAAEQLHSSALLDIAKGRFTTASMALFGGSIHATDKQYALLEEVSLRRQGPMATVNVLIARSCRTRSAEKALEAAEIAESLGLDAVESRCAVLALDFAREAGKSILARSASQRLERLHRNLPNLPLKPQSAGVKLTPREVQVAKLAKRGLGNRAIADRIGVSVRTVEGHLYQLYSKLGITNRHELLEDQDI